MFTDSDEETQHEDDEEITEDKNKKRREHKNDERQGELDEEEEFLAGFAEASNIRRFHDFENNEGPSKGRCSDSNFDDNKHINLC
jgi:hypothetical protein